MENIVADTPNVQVDTVPVENVSTGLDAIAEKNKDNPLLDSEGFRRHKPLSERIYRALAMIIFIIVFPFVVVFLGIYRLFSLIGSRKALLNCIS